MHTSKSQKTPKSKLLHLCAQCSKTFTAKKFFTFKTGTKITSKDVWVFFTLTLHMEDSIPSMCSTTCWTSPWLLPTPN